MKIGVIAGNFDCMHPGYIKMFKECKEHCDYLVVLLHSDPTIERPDTKLKPVLSVEDRTEMLMHLESVNNVLTYDTESDLLHVLSDMVVDVRFLGDDYVNKPFTGDELDIPIHYINRSHGWSTTKFKKAIRDSYNELHNNE